MDSPCYSAALDEGDPPAPLIFADSKSVPTFTILLLADTRGFVVIAIQVEATQLLSLTGIGQAEFVDNVSSGLIESRH